MADLPSPERETEETGGDQAVEIELEPALVSGEAQDGDESPPDYTTVLREMAPPSLGYEESLATESLTPHSERTLTAEAPPSYRQLFGKGVELTRLGHTPYRQRRHIIRRQECQRTQSRWRKFIDGIPEKTKKTVKTVVISVLLIVGACLPLSMITVGSINYTKCAVAEIPLYLIVSGCFLLLDLIYHTLVSIFQRFCDNETICCVARKCDCFAFFLFTWLLVGSAWALKTGMRGDHCDGTDCEDCPSGVYSFTVVVIIGQYVAALLLIICCCTSVIKSTCT